MKGLNYWSFRNQTGNHRSASGSALVMSVGALSTVLAFVVGGASLVLHIGSASYYQDKVQFVASQAAAYAAGELSWCNSKRAGATVSDATQVTVPVVNKLLSDLGLPAPYAVDITADNEKATVTVSVRGVAMPRGAFLPDAINVMATASKRFDEDEPPVVCIIGLETDRRTYIAVPAYSGPPHLLSPKVTMVIPAGVGTQ